MPGFGAVNSNGPKFLAIAILNLVSLIVFLTDHDFRQRTEIQSGFFRNNIGIAYTLFVLISLLSFCNAINVTEAVMNFVKIFTVFAASCMLFVILSSNRDYFLHIIVLLALLLFIDSLTVFYQIAKYIAGNIETIFDIQSVYSNKNVFAAAMFVKLSAAIWLMYFTNGWQKKTGYITVVSAILAILFMSARAFYVGLILLSAALAIYAFLRFIGAREKSPLIGFIHFTVLLILALVVYSITQRYLFPKNKDLIAYNKDVVTRVTEIKQEISPPGKAKPASPGFIRLASWQRSWKLIHQHPILGVGTGNWKIAVLKYENPGKADFNYIYKNHNDFIEVTAETGLLGGLGYLALIFLVPFVFFKASLNRATAEEKLKYLFLPAFGLLAYSVDAFFNFPADRPEMQILFALYVAAAAAAIDQSPSPVYRIEKIIFNKVTAAFMILLLCISAYVMFQNLKSLRFQRYVLEDDVKNRMTYPASFIVERFSAIPNLSSQAEPIATIKARYLIHENRCREAITLLLADNSSPYDSRREFYMAKAYEKMGLCDSASVWIKRAYQLKPLYLP